MRTLVWSTTFVRAFKRATRRQPNIGRCWPSLNRTLPGQTDGDYRPIASAPVTCHGASYVLGVRLVEAIRRGLKLTARDGISDEEFYSRK